MPRMLTRRHRLTPTWAKVHYWGGLTVACLVAVAVTVIWEVPVLVLTPMILGAFMAGLTDHHR